MSGTLPRPERGFDFPLPDFRQGEFFTAEISADVRYWHLADMPSCTANVRFRG